MVETVLLCTEAFAACIGHSCILQPALPAPEHKIPAVEKPVTSALVPILGGGDVPSQLTGLAPPARPPSRQTQMMRSTHCSVCCGPQSYIAWEWNSEETHACDPSCSIAPASHPAQGATPESASVLSLIPFSDGQTTWWICDPDAQMPRKSKRVAPVA